jgi:glycosyltransferase involved in cell wall biosynthesis
LKVLHVIVGLDVGGAESMLKRLVEADPGGPNSAIVVSLTKVGVIGERLSAQGAKVYALGMTSLIDIPVALWRLVALIRMHRPTIVQTWLYHADLLGGLAGRLAGSRRVVWNIRSTHLAGGPRSFSHWLVRVCALCSHVIPHRIICCAESARLIHVELGYDDAKMVVIPNGYDFSVFDTGQESRARARTELEFGCDQIVIGTVGRFDAIKDYRTFVAAASHLTALRSDVVYLMVGRNIEWSNVVLRAWIEGGGAFGRFRLVGQQSNVPYFLAAMDIFCLSSSCGEAFPNALAEAMAMKLPCVVTNVGDAASILGDTEHVVPPRDPHALCMALKRMCELGDKARAAIGERAAKRVRAEFQIEQIWNRYAQVYTEALGS